MVAKDVRIVASVLMSSKPAEHETAKMEQWKMMVARMADNLASTNEKFSYQKFFAACNW